MGARTVHGSGPENAPVRSSVAGGRVWQRLLLPLLALLPLATFGPRLGREFVFYDDDVYITLNDGIRHGLTWTGVVWAFTTGHAANWHPLTWLSHMADVSLFGMNPVAHHATNLLLHVINTLLLFLALRALTGSPWRSAWVAALFAVHPAHVESVAWAAERKDLLSTAFGLGAVWAYGRWVRERGAGRYALVLLLFAAGLMSKPMLVSLPFVLLLLDFWPLHRWEGNGEPPGAARLARSRTAALLLEKAPLFLMAAASCVVTFVVQRAGEAVKSFVAYPLPARIGNALFAYAGYLRILFWPANLAVFYPHPGTALAAWKILGSALLLAGLSAGAVLLRRRAPFLVVGWLWFLVTLFPVIGVVQVGHQAMADRYTYLPFVGLFLAIAWAVPPIAARWRYGRAALPIAAAAVLAAASVAAAAQAGYWRNSEALFLHAIAVTKDSPLAHNNLSHYYNETGRPAEGLPHASEAVRIQPENPANHNNRGVSLFELGRVDEALEEFSTARRLKPHDPVVLNNNARARFVRGEIPEAVRDYEAAAVLAPASAEIRGRLAVALLLEEKFEPARLQIQHQCDLAPADENCRALLRDVTAFQRNPGDASLVRFRRFLASAHLDASIALEARNKRPESALHLRRSIELAPDFAEARSELGARLAREGRLAQAKAEYQRSLEIDPGSAIAHNNIGYLLFLQGNRAAAVKEYLEALKLRPQFPLARQNLDRALQGENRE